MTDTSATSYWFALPTLIDRPRFSFLGVPRWPNRRSYIRRKKAGRKGAK